MLNFQRKSCDCLLIKRYFATKASVNDLKDGKKYQKTLFLPKTDFPSYYKPKEVNERDVKIQKECRFLDYYAWQRENIKGKEFVLHDGPPYANGKPHIGHAINKIMKDIILRSQAIQGCRLHFIPGWDCHGLPIELIAIKDSFDSLDAIKIREKARNVALSMSQIQKEAFKQWGVMGDWDNQCYYTFDVKYAINQLKVFWKMYEKGFIFYDVKPVYWSPSTQTALAEAELIYEDHTSKALTVRFETVQDVRSEPLYLLVWTTTPWTLPLNAAVYFSPQISYSIIKIGSWSGSYIIATDLINELQSKVKGDVSVVSTISNDALKKLQYKHPWNKERVLKVFESTNVKVSGTGLLHSVPAHGHDDFTMGLVNNLKVESFIDEKGYYMSNVGDKLAGLFALEEGSDRVIEHLSSDIVAKENYNHSYPYDWRTKKPVLIRASNQWFIDITQLKTKAIECLKDVKVPLQYFQSQLLSRSYWCLSRQRKWGVPIPVFFHKTSKRPLISKNLIDHLCHLLESSGTDIWWTGKNDVLFPNKICQELFVKREDVVKGDDIMDIWFDSGITWSYALQGKKSDVYLEGVDQYRGWFQSSLLTSVGTGNGAPFKRIITHGFAVDSNGNKMSKSIGNVVDPEGILKGDNAFGVDTLRWWVGSHSSSHKIPVSNSILRSDFESVQRIRLVLRFLLGALNKVSENDLIEKPKELQTLDVYMLNSCYLFYESVLGLYNDYNIQSVCAKILYFISNVVSALYIAVVKDRLYCDGESSNRRKVSLYVCNAILNTVSYAMAPILPHLAEEIFLYHPVYKGKNSVFFNEKPWKPPQWWANESADEIMNVILKIRKDLLLEKNLIKMICTIEATEEDYKFLKKMESEDEKSIEEILQVAKVQLKRGNETKFSLSPVSANQCPRCRLYNLSENEELCTRCEKVVSNFGEFT